MASSTGAPICLILTAALAGAPLPACEYWQLAGPFTLQQSNRITVHGELTQTGRRLSGRASFYSPTLGDGGTTLAGDIDGHIEGDAIELDVYWYGNYEQCAGECYASSYDAGARYQGRIDPDGRISGVNFEFDRPQAQVRWTLAGAVQCGNPPPSMADRVRETGPIAPLDANGAMTHESGGFAPRDVGAAKVMETEGFARSDTDNAASRNLRSVQPSVQRRSLQPRQLRHALREELP